MPLPALEETLLGSILNTLPEEVSQVQESLEALTDKYRSDLYSQLSTTLEFQKHVVRSHEKLSKRFKRTVRNLEIYDKNYKVDALTTSKDWEEIEESSKEVMGRLMGIVDILKSQNKNNIDSERFPLLKRVIHDDFEVVDWEEAQEEENEEVEERADEEEGADQTINEDDEQFRTALEIHETDSHSGQEVKEHEKTDRQELQIEAVEDGDQNENEEKELESLNEELGGVTIDDTIDDDTREEQVSRENILESLDSDYSNGQSTSSPLPIPQSSLSQLVSQPSTSATDGSIRTNDTDELTSLESAINKYKTKKLRSFPLPTTPSSSSSLHYESSTTIQGTLSHSSSKSLNDSLKKFM